MTSLLLKETEGLRGDVMVPTGGWGVGVRTWGQVSLFYYSVRLGGICFFMLMQLLSTCCVQLGPGLGTVDRHLLTVT